MKKLVFAFTIAIFATLAFSSSAYAGVWRTDGCHSGECPGRTDPVKGQYCTFPGEWGLLTLEGPWCHCSDDGSGTWENCGGTPGPGGGSIHNPLVAVEGVTALANYIGTFWQTAYIVAGLLVWGYLLFGGILYITASGDKEAVAKAQKIITNAIIGLVILAASYPVIKVIEVVFGISILQIRWPTV